MNYQTNLSYRKEGLIFSVALIKKNYITPVSDPGISKPGRIGILGGLELF